LHKLQYKNNGEPLGSPLFLKLH